MQCAKGLTFGDLRSACASNKELQIAKTYPHINDVPPMDVARYVFDTFGYMPTVDVKSTHGSRWFDIDGHRIYMHDHRFEPSAYLHEFDPDPDTFALSGCELALVYQFGDRGQARFEYAGDELDRLLWTYFVECIYKNMGPVIGAACMETDPRLWGAAREYWVKWMPLARASISNMAECDVYELKSLGLGVSNCVDLTAGPEWLKSFCNRMLWLPDVDLHWAWHRNAVKWLCECRAQLNAPTFCQFLEQRITLDMIQENLVEL